MPLSLHLFRQPRLVVYADSNAQESLKVLFVGNSLTYYNDMPAIMIGLIRQEQPDLPLKIAMVTAPGASLHDHYRSGKLEMVLQEHGPWNWVALQEKGGLPLAQPEEVQHYTRLLANQVRKSGRTSGSKLLSWRQLVTRGSAVSRFRALTGSLAARLKHH